MVSWSLAKSVSSHSAFRHWNLEVQHACHQRCGLLNTVMNLTPFIRNEHMAHVLNIQKTLVTSSRALSQSSSPLSDPSPSSFISPPEDCKFFFENSHDLQQSVIHLQDSFKLVGTKSQPYDRATCNHQQSKEQQTSDQCREQGEVDPKASTIGLKAPTSRISNKKFWTLQCSIQKSAVAWCCLQQSSPQSNACRALSQHIVKLLGHTFQTKTWDKTWATTCMDMGVVALNSTANTDWQIQAKNQQSTSIQTCKSKMCGVGHPGYQRSKGELTFWKVIGYVWAGLYSKARKFWAKHVRAIVRIKFSWVSASQARVQCAWGDSQSTCPPHRYKMPSLQEGQLITWATHDFDWNLVLCSAGCNTVSRCCWRSIRCRPHATTCNSHMKIW